MNHPSPVDYRTAMRAIDANLNRTNEAIRVLEDVARFGQDNSFLTHELKKTRHKLVRVFAPISQQLIRHRDTRFDVGTEIRTDSEQIRHGIDGIIAANGARAQQALRALEEFSKPIETITSESIERIRYQVYALEKALVGNRRSTALFEDRQLYVLVDGDEGIEDFRERVAKLVEAGVGVVQLRDKAHTDRALLEQAVTLVQMTRNTNTLAIINDRVDIAVAAGADGVHLGQDELTIAAARRVAGDRISIGVSVHSIEQAQAAVLDGADYLGVGPTFPSSTKSFDSFPGLPLLTQVANQIRLPAFAIGGISSDNLDDVVATGMTRAAVQSAVSDLTTISQSVAQLQVQLSGESCPQP